MPIHYMVKDKNSNNTESVNSIFVLRIECKSSKSSKSGKSKFEVVIEELSNIEELRKIKELNNKCVLFYVDEKCKDKFKKIITEEKFKNRFLNKDLKIFISKLESKGLEKGFKIMDMEIMEKENTERCDTKSPLNDNVTISSNSGEDNSVLEEMGVGREAENNSAAVKPESSLVLDFSSFDSSLTAINAKIQSLDREGETTKSSLLRHIYTKANEIKTRSSESVENKGEDLRTLIAGAKGLIVDSRVELSKYRSKCCSGFFFGTLLRMDLDERVTSKLLVNKLSEQLDQLTNQLTNQLASQPEENPVAPSPN